jgi:penicillin-binding protein 1B
MASREKSTGAGAKSKRHVRLRLGILGRAWRFTGTPLGAVLLGLVLVLSAVGAVVYNHYYWEFRKIIDSRLEGGAFDRTARFLATPRTISVGDPASIEAIAKNLRAAGYSRHQENEVGWYELVDGGIQIHPGPLSHFEPDPAHIEIEDGRVVRIVLVETGDPLSAYLLEPELITNLFDLERSKRRLFKFGDYPQHLVNAVIAIEDHRFFTHHGIDFIRTTSAAFEGIREWKRPRGTSTLTQQLARNFFLTREATLSRKFSEAMIALQLEGRLSKEEIFENYANQIFMGRLGSFNVHGLGEAARGFFDKDIRDVTLAEAALLAGLPQGPSYLNPYRYPDRAQHRRNQVLAAMLREGFIDQASYEVTAQEGIVLSQGHMDSRDAPFFIDLVRKDLAQHFETEELVTGNYWVYTSLDKQLQEFAVEAVREGMKLVDERVARQRRFRGKTPPRAQAALVAMDPRTGEVKAIVGGRDYGGSQLNRALAKRQPGSTFKPFVYAAAIDTALDRERAMMIGRGHGASLPDYAKATYPPPPAVLTTSSIVNDVPTAFEFDEIQPPYKPSNHLDKFYGQISLRYALMRSINVATVKVGEMAGYQRVADLAERVEMGENVDPFPSLLLGAYEVTPLDVAAAYSAFVNKGVRAEPRFVQYVRTDQGDTLFQSELEQRDVMDTRVAYIVTHMMRDVIRYGSGVRARYTYGITDAAGKTGTDDDGWFAGFTNNLVCAVWVGFDDNTDLALEGAHSALPIWAMFMKNAHELAIYADPGPFEQPQGVVRLPVDPVQRMLAENFCKGCTEEVYIAGTQPSGADMASYVSARKREAAAAEAEATARSRRGFLKRVFGIFKESKQQAAAAPE